MIDNKILYRIERIYEKVWDETLTPEQARNEVKKVLENKRVENYLELQNSPVGKELISKHKEAIPKQSVVPGFHNQSVKGVQSK